MRTLFIYSNLTIFQRANTQNHPRTYTRALSLFLSYTHSLIYYHTHTQIHVRIAPNTIQRTEFVTLRQRATQYTYKNCSHTTTQLNCDTSICEFELSTIIVSDIAVSYRSYCGAIVEFRILKIYLKLENDGEHTRKFLFVFFVFCECFFPKATHISSVRESRVFN